MTDRCFFFSDFMSCDSFKGKLPPFEFNSAVAFIASVIRLTLTPKKPHFPRLTRIVLVGLRGVNMFLGLSLTIHRAKQTFLLGFSWFIVIL